VSIRQVNYFDIILRGFALACMLQWSLPAAADSGQASVRVDSARDGTFKLAPCEPGISFCGTAPDAEPIYVRSDDGTGIVLNPTAPVSAALLSGGSVGGPVGTGNATISASAAAMRGYVSAGASGSWYRLGYRDEFGDPQEIFFFQGSMGAASADALYLDEIVLGGPAGMMGTFNLVLSFDRSFDVNGQFAGGSASAQVSFAPNTPSGPGSALAVVGISDCHNCGNPLFTTGQTFQAMAGTTGVLTQMLTLNATATAGQAGPNNSIAIWAGNTMHAYLEPLTPGFTVSSASGYSYSMAAVPEPAMYGLLIGGLAMVAIVVRRRGRGSERAAR
jgi:hypothetical protein